METTKPHRRGTPKPEASDKLTATANARLQELRRSRLMPHNLVDRGPNDPVPAYLPSSAPHTTRRVLIACMKDEGPYILEWVAYHRLIGFTDIVIFTNDCSDGSVRLIKALQAEGLVTHFDNSRWSGQSPQQAALNRAIDLPLLRKADWVAHIDVDEFINIRCGNGTLDDLFAALPQASHIAMTWRLFGHSGVRRFEDRPVISQFTRCAPSFCPKPHTVWGFKTLARHQIGAYGKLSCHRPTKPAPDVTERTAWFNGSGQRITGDIALRGWRSNARSIGYDLVQLNHYALRSADGFLIKRQRGRALHVDREIGRNYWVRMDWNDHQERSIQRNLPRLDQALRRLKGVASIAAAHDACVEWHRARAKALRTSPEGAKLLATLSELTLSAPERVALALTQDMES